MSAKTLTSKYDNILHDWLKKMLSSEHLFFGYFIAAEPMFHPL